METSGREVLPCDQVVKSVNLVTVEPRVEELLATIRKAIDHDIDELDRAVPASGSTSGRSSGTLMRGSLREMRVSFADDTPVQNSADESIAKLRERVGRQKIEDRVSTAAVASQPRPPMRANPKPQGIGEILTGDTRPPRLEPPLLRASYIDDEPQAYIEPQHYAPQPQEPTWIQDPPPVDPYYGQAPQQALMSPQAAYSAQNSFQALADSIMARAIGEGDLEGVTRDMLRPMLKAWLDDNLPPLVEKLVREEIERVARRGR